MSTVYTFSRVFVEENKIHRSRRTKPQNLGVPLKSQHWFRPSPFSTPLCKFLFVYDLETAAAVYRNRISPDPIFLTAESSTTGGFYAINRRGQVLHATVNDATVVPFVSGQLNDLELAVNLAKRANLPVAENLVVQRFQELFSQTKYKEAAELAAESPQGLLRTPETVAKFQKCHVWIWEDLINNYAEQMLQYFSSSTIDVLHEEIDMARMSIKEKNQLEIVQNHLEQGEESTQSRLNEAGDVLQNNELSRLELIQKYEDAQGRVQRLKKLLLVFLLIAIARILVPTV